MNKFPGLCVFLIRLAWERCDGRTGRWTFTLWGNFGAWLGGGVWARPGRGSLLAAARRTSSSCRWICCWMRMSSPSSPCWGTAQGERGGVSCQSHEARGGGGGAYSRWRDSGDKRKPAHWEWGKLRSFFFFWRPDSQSCQKHILMLVQTGQSLKIALYKWIIYK